VIIQTRYRDISFEELRRVHDAMFYSSARVGDWSEKRGKLINVETPPIPEEQLDPNARKCGERWYRIVSGVFQGNWVCPHIAEIGD